MDDPERIDALLQAFERFCQETARLEASYADLKQEFQKVNLELESILGHISQGLLFIDAGGTLILLNRAAETLLGKKKEKAVGSSFSEVFGDFFFKFSMKEALLHKKAPSFCRLSLGDTEVDVETKFISATGVEGLIVTLRDRTELQRLELLASHHDRMRELGELAAEVAHEIRNPLGGIKGFAYLLKRDLKGQSQEKLVDFIIEGTENLNHLVTQVLDYSRPVKPHFSRLKVADLIQATKALIDLDATIQPKPSLQVSLSPKTLELHGDEAMMKGALLNLFVNSCQAMPHGGDLKIQGRLEKNELILEISDTGAGISKKNREKIFSPFFTTKSKGTGLGLAEVHKIIQAHAGKIEVQSEEGKGTKFIIKIPQKGVLNDT